MPSESEHKHVPVLSALWEGDYHKTKATVVNGVILKCIRLFTRWIITHWSHPKREGTVSISQGGQIRLFAGVRIAIEIPNAVYSQSPGKHVSVVIKYLVTFILQAF